ncbi:hypothetical protein G6F29_004062 [Rhizopus arrhizus]|nr:hypothetical protein G6F23_013500 [Rhizopus arrhizus]KAG0781541.1 hypothetical protein G6F22_009516 [Rhizopus arrhizus]KAG0805210.1 hypothetical protein G6F20_012090 [Rhizopus arrhizus]KAG0821637.1 hypothetical protein G6F18_012108 [Rhizopus arrhizus]KAG0826486.1 hypothetical protein G6F19_009267 [Rhizopus arrhizus]
MSNATIAPWWSPCLTGTTPIAVGNCAANALKKVAGKTAFGISKATLFFSADLIHIRAWRRCRDAILAAGSSKVFTLGPLIALEYAVKVCQSAAESCPDVD